MKEGVRLLEMQKQNCSMDSDNPQWECEALLRLCTIRADFAFSSGVCVVRRHSTDQEQSLME
eukprot:12889417-Prorocentrum_lima.AAC.1